MTERPHFHFSLSCTGEGNSKSLQYSCLENPRDSGVWWAAVYGVAQSRIRLKQLSSSSSSNRGIVRKVSWPRERLQRLQPRVWGCFAELRCILKSHLAYSHHFAKCFIAPLNFNKTFSLKNLEDNDIGGPKLFDRWENWDVRLLLPSYVGC